jgi:transposase
MSKQKSYTKEFKFRVAIEMIKGDLTIAEIISKYQVPRSVLSKWKKQLLDNGPEVYKKAISQCRRIIMVIWRNYMQR